MPHLIIEYSSNVAEHHDIDDFLDAVHRAFVDTGVPKLPGVRVRAIEQNQYRIADGSNPNHAYVAMVARFGPGRDDETSQRVIVEVLDAAEAQLASEDGPLIIAWSMEVQEIDANYRVNRNHIAKATKGEE